MIRRVPVLLLGLFLTPLAVAQEAGDFALLTTKGDTLQLSSLRGRVVLLNLWATWCAPCLKEMPDLNELHAELNPLGLTVVGLAVDGGAGEADGSSTPVFRGLPGKTDDRRTIDRFVDRLGVTYPVVYGSNAAAMAVLGGNAMPILPTTLIIDPEGRIADRIVGTVPIEETRRSLLTLLQP